MSNRRTWYILVIFSTVLLIFLYYYYNRDISYHYYKVSRTVFDESDNIVSDTLIFEKGELIIKTKNNPEWYSHYFVIQNYDDNFGYWINSEIKKGNSKTAFGAFDDYGEYAVEINKTKNTAFICQTESQNELFYFITFYLDDN